MIHALRTGLVVAVVVAAGYALFANWSDVRGTVLDIGWAIWIPAFLVLPLAIAAATMSWQVLVDELGEPIGVPRGAQIFLVGQLGKYLPGSVWAYVLQMELGRRAGLARARVFTATIFSLGVVVVAALLAGSLAIPALIADNPNLSALRWLYVMLPVGVVCLHPRILTRIVEIGFRLLRRPLPDHPIRKRAVLASLAWALLSYALFGLHLFILVEGAADPSWRDLPLAIGTMSVAMVSGLFFFLLPSGAGVREVVIVTGLASLVGTGPAIALAAVSRVFLTLADMLTAGAASLLAVVSGRDHEPYHGDPGIRPDEE